MLNYLNLVLSKGSLKILGWTLTSTTDAAAATGLSLRTGYGWVTISPSSFLFGGAQAASTSWLS